MKPTRYLRYARHRLSVRFHSLLLPVLFTLALSVLLLGIIAVIRSPDDYQQGVTVKIMYLHVPFAWLSMLCYSLMGLCSIVTLCWSQPIAEIALKCAAPIGAMFTALTLVSGSLWGRPTWGTWWEWDARMTSVLVLFFIYLAIIGLSRGFRDHLRAGQAAAILTLFGLINIPIIRFSVDWWNTLHQRASLLRFNSSTIDPTMLWPLTLMTIGFSLLFLAHLLFAIRNEVGRRTIEMHRMIIAQRQRALHSFTKTKVIE